MDMGQNVPYPSLSTEQAGKTYYMSPLVGNILGIVDNSTDHLTAYVWKEGDANRGMNNIVSCLHQYLKKLLIFDHVCSDLVIVVDNCGGQNKNKCILRYLIWLVEAGFIDHVKLIFLVAGHTKNKCDRMFNLLKNDYHKVDVFSFKQLLAVLDRNDFVTVIHMVMNLFLDFNSWLHQYYTSPRTDTINRFHEFHVNSSNPTVMKRYLYGDVMSEPYEQDFLPRSFPKKLKTKIRRNRLKLSTMEKNLKRLIPPGIRPIKQVEMYIEWRTITPMEYWDETCPEPTEEIKNLVKTQKTVKNELKEEEHVASKRDSKKMMTKQKATKVNKEKQLKNDTSKECKRNKQKKKHQSMKK